MGFQTGFVVTKRLNFGVFEAENGASEGIPDESGCSPGVKGNARQTAWRRITWHRVNKNRGTNEQRLSASRCEFHRTVSA
jgi:hypothetical protein